jgi:hypothetical protein
MAIRSGICREGRSSGVRDETIIIRVACRLEEDIDE